MSQLQSLYDRCPIWVQECFVNLYGIRVYFTRYTGDYEKFKRCYMGKNYGDYSQQINEQKELFQKFIIHCKENIPFYRELLKNTDVSQWTIADLPKLPFVDKEMIRSRFNEFRVTEGYTTNTGGTTGKSLQVVYIKRDIEKRMAYLDAFKERHGVKLGMKVARFSGKGLVPQNSKSTKYWRTNHVIKQRLYSTFHINESTLQYYVDDLNRFKPLSFDGFITSIYELAKYIEKYNIKLEFQLIAIFPTAETILPHHREVVERVFNCPVRDQYASSEGAPFITECVCGKKHYNMDTGIIEIIGDNSMFGEVAVTSFMTHGTPLVRYLIGDVMEFSNEKCSCGSSHPVVKQIIGRNTDFLFSEERGRIYSANMSNVIKYLPNSVICIQYIQKKSDYIEINVVFDQKLFKEAHIDSIIDEMKNRLGVAMKFKVNTMDEIPRSKSGKFRFIINEAL